MCDLVILLLRVQKILRSVRLISSFRGRDSELSLCGPLEGAAWRGKEMVACGFLLNKCNLYALGRTAACMNDA